MRKGLLKTVMLLMCLMIGMGAFAIPANRQAITIKQPNGKMLTFILGGDENVHWAKTTDQYMLVRNDEGFFTYGILNEKGDLVASKYLATNPNERTAEERAFLSTLPVNLFYSGNQVAEMKASSPKGRISDDTKYPSHGTVKLLVILVGFSDLPFTYTNQDFVNLVSQDNYNGTGSVKDYYRDNSNGEFIMDIDVAGPYTLPNNMRYYGQNSSSGHDANMARFVQHALNAADADVNYRDYDNDGDGKVDAVHIIFAGTPESSTGNSDEIWPHRSNVDRNIQKDGVRFGPYSCSAEKRNSVQMDGIGTICHEFGHVLGFPDFYDTDYSGSGGEAVTPGTWDLMASGSYMNNSASPVGLSSVERWIADWFTFDTLTSTAENIYLPALNSLDTTVAYMIPLNSNEYFVVENRQQTRWDTYLPGEGMLIFHCDQSKLNRWLQDGINNINTAPNDRGYFLRPASGRDADVESTRCPYPGATGNANFTDNTNPASTLKDGTLTNKPITNIHYENDSLIRFNFMSSLPAVRTDGVTSSTITSTTAVAWGGVVYEAEEVEHAITERGIVWSTSAEDLDNIVVSNIHYVPSDSTGDVFSAMLTALVPNSTIYYKAYASNADGTGYGVRSQFTTLSGLGTIITRAASNISNGAATVEANLINMGDGTFVAKGFAFTTDGDENPTIDGSMVYTSTDGTLGTFNCTIDTLSEGVTYYYRAYITTNLGTNYGTKRNFTTIYPAVENNVISADQSFCAGATPELLVGSEPTGGRGNFTYQWQEKKRTGNWSNATQVSDQRDYQPESLEDSTFYRRIVFSNGTIKDTSNTVLMNVLISRGGRITKSVEDTITLNSSTGTLRVVSYRGDIVDWERQINESAWESLNNTNVTFSETPDSVAMYSYRVKVQISTCPEAYSEVQSIYVKENPSSLKDVENDFEFTVSPNPASSYITIQSPDKRAENVCITNLLGQEVYNESNCDLSNKRIELGNFENGTYVISITCNGRKSVKQIVVNK